MVSTDLSKLPERWRRAGQAAGAALVIAATIMLLLPLWQRPPDSSPGHMSRNNLKQLALALHNYGGDRDWVLPPGTLIDDQGATLHGWEALLLPYMDQGPLYAQIDFAQPWNSAENLKLFHESMRIFRDFRYRQQEDADGLPVSHYAANELVLRPGQSLGFDEITDGTSNTILAGTVAGNPRGWGTPFNLRDPRAGLNAGPRSFGCPRGSTLLLSVDGSVHHVNEKMSPDVLRALGTPAGGEQVALPP
jgi:hypothetical protein